MKNLLKFCLLIGALLALGCGTSQKTNGVAPQLVNVDSGWAANSVNVVVFRKNSLVTFKDTQFVAFYSGDKHVVLGKRKLGSANWQLQKTAFTGNAADAHNTISIMTDGEGYLHLAWDHHNNPLHYARSISPGSLTITAMMPMTGNLEQAVSYPEFYYLASGDLVFFYRDGGSGKGNLVVNYYNTKNRNWTQLHDNLIDGEGQRNAYWQACTDSKGSIHISWVWRESPDVASNHDLCYARSDDNGKTWVKSNGDKYDLPINASTAEYAFHIPPQSELINQTSMFADKDGMPYIATYWRETGDSIPQYHIVYKNAGGWQVNNTAFRKTAFSLSGAGTKSIPISRPQIVANNLNGKTAAFLIFRDQERGAKVSVALTEDITSNTWKLRDLTDFSVGSWEPTYDTELWKKKNTIDLFLENVVQKDGEGVAETGPKMISVLSWKPAFK